MFEGMSEKFAVTPRHNFSSAAVEKEKRISIFIIVMPVRTSQTWIDMRYKSSYKFVVFGIQGGFISIYIYTHVRCPSSISVLRIVQYSIA